MKFKEWRVLNGHAVMFDTYIMYFTLPCFSSTVKKIVESDYGAMTLYGIQIYFGTLNFEKCH